MIGLANPWVILGAVGIYISSTSLSVSLLTAVLLKADALVIGPLGLAVGGLAGGTAALRTIDKKTAAKAATEDKRTAEGVRPSDGGIEDIPSREWVYLQADADNGREFFSFRHNSYRHVYSSVVLRRDEIVRIWPRVADATKRGAPSEYDWPKINAEMTKLMDHHGDFDSADPEWNRQARLEKALQEFCSTQWRREPATGTLRPKIKRWLMEWRVQKAKVGN